MLGKLLYSSLMIGWRHMEKFENESKMSRAFSDLLSGLNKDSIFYIQELKGLFGVPDYILVEVGKDGIVLNSVAVELKLHNWKRALSQAFRYHTFANSSFVIIDAVYIHRAINNIELFRKYNIGLASFGTDSSLSVYYMPKPSQPFNHTYINRITSISSERFCTPEQKITKRKTLQDYLNQISRVSSLQHA